MSMLREESTGGCSEVAGLMLFSLNPLGLKCPSVCSITAQVGVGYILLPEPWD